MPSVEVEEEMAGYFAGSLRRFTVPVHMPGTSFAAAVWSALPALPYGATCSYGELAQRLGSPVRAAPSAAPTVVALSAVTGPSA